MFTKKITAFCTAAMIALSLAACGSSDSSASESKAPSDSTAQSTDAGDNSGNGGDQGAVTIYDDERHPVETEPVVETLGDFDISDVQNELNVDPDFKLELEAEDGDLTKPAVVFDSNTQGEFSGKGFVFLANDTAEVSFDIELEQTGNYDINLVVAGESSNASAAGKIMLDDASLTTYSITTNKFARSSAINLTLEAGKHKLSFPGSDKQIFIDSVTITATAAVDLEQYKVRPELINPNASDETKRLYNFLKDCFGRYTISGQYSSDNLGPACAEIYKINDVTGQSPAILGLDFVEVSLSRVQSNLNRDSYETDEEYQAAVRQRSDETAQVLIEQAKEWYLEKGGIVTFCWHWNAPLGTFTDSWWKGFYSNSTNFSIAKALSKEDQAGYDAIIADIDNLARYLKVLDDAHVPILWRPLHEGGGDPKWHNPWFWWGSSGSKAYIELWQLLYDRLTNYHGINNLIWVWNGQDPDYYVGDDYCDIVGYDIYADGGDTSSQKAVYDMMKETIGENKIIALTENGVIPDPDSTFADGSRWAWFATWNGEFCIDGDFNLNEAYTPLEMWKKIYTHDRVLTLSELPDLKCYPIDTEKYLAEHAS